MAQYTIHLTLGVENLDKARKFYEEQMGLEVLESSMPGMLLFGVGNEVSLLVYEKAFAKERSRSDRPKVDEAKKMIQELEDIDIEMEYFN